MVSLLQLLNLLVPVVSFVSGADPETFCHQDSWLAG
jgi:hypothetical protein